MISTDQWDLFFLAFEKVGIIKTACAASGIGRRTVYDHIEAGKGSDATPEQKEWHARYKDAERAAIDTLEAEAWRRAVDGCRRPLYTRDGKPITNPATGEHAYELAHSDNLTIFLLKSRDPARFKDRVAQEVTGANGGPIQTESKVIAVPAIDEDAEE